MDLETEIKNIRLLYQELKELQEKEIENTKKKIDLDLQHLKYQHTYQRLRVKITLNNYEKLWTSEKNLKITINSQNNSRNELKEEIATETFKCASVSQSNLEFKSENNQTFKRFRNIFKKNVQKSDRKLYEKDDSK